LSGEIEQVVVSSAMTLDAVIGVMNAKARLPELQRRGD
jgi:hypothetical protein